jgi:hypothetical protein
LYEELSDLPEGDRYHVFAPIWSRPPAPSGCGRLSCSGYLAHEGEVKSGVPNGLYFIDALKALIGVVYLDAGFIKAINSCVDCSYVEITPTCRPSERPKDRIARVVAAQMNLPIYRVGHTSAAHQTNDVECEIAELAVLSAASNIAARSGEQVAAAMLAVIKAVPTYPSGAAAASEFISHRPALLKSIQDRPTLAALYSLTLHRPLVQTYQLHRPLVSKRKHQTRADA